MQYRIPARVTNIFERKLQKYVTGFGQNTAFTTESAGWYIEIDNSFCLWVGADPPKVKIGDEIDIILRSPNANS